MRRLKSSMNLSSHSLFHYTREFANVFSIIQNGLRFSHNVDEMPLRGLKGDVFTELGVVKSEWHSDIICFCDIPLSLSGDHRAQYGDYVLGFSKEWAMQHSITPLRYVHVDSPDYKARHVDWILALHQMLSHNKGDLISMLREAWAETIEEPAPTDDEMEALPPSIKRLLSEMNGLFKSILGPAYANFHLVKLHRGNWTDRKTGQTTERYFYDEREWRAVGKVGDCLRFTIDDLTRIILKDESERQYLFKQIKDEYPALSEAAKFRLFSIIATWDEILRDH